MAGNGNNNKILRETKSMSAAETTAAAAVEAVSSVKCYCCGLTEECTPRYIDRVRERYEGRWICGLCAEAVKEETLKSRRDISTDEALKRHISFFQEFRSSSSSSSPQDLILAMKQLLLRSLDSSSSSSSSPRSSCGGRRLGRSQSCFSSVSSRPTSQPNPHSQNRIVHGRDIREDSNLNAASNETDDAANNPRTQLPKTSLNLTDEYVHEQKEFQESTYAL